jgi:hypothetical protein
MKKRTLTIAFMLTTLMALAAHPALAGTAYMA